MNRRQMFSLLAAIPIVAAGVSSAMATPSSERKVDGNPVATELSDLRYELDFERHGWDWIERAYHVNFELETRDTIARGSICFDEFADADHSLFVTLRGPDIVLLNTVTHKTAYAPRESLRIEH